MPIVKICGITTRDDALHAVRCGADLLGFIQYPPSPRYVSPRKVRAIIQELPDGVRTVGVFVNESGERIRRVAEEAGFDVIQLHGDESTDVLYELTKYEVIKAIGLREPSDVIRAEEWSSVPLLVDTPCPQFGGSGEVGDWSLARELATTRTIYLAGGLNPDNVAEAIRVVNPHGVDVSSGVELSKGIKDHAKVREFIANVRDAEVPQ